MVRHIVVKSRAAILTLRLEKAEVSQEHPRCATAFLIAAGFLAIGMPLGACILLSLLAAPASFLLLRRYFAAAAPRAGAAVGAELAER